MVQTKEYIKMRSAEPIKFLFLRKMDIVGHARQQLEICLKYPNFQSFFMEKCINTKK